MSAAPPTIYLSRFKGKEMRFIQFVKKKEIINQQICVDD